MLDFKAVHRWFERVVKPSANWKGKKVQQESYSDLVLALGPCCAFTVSVVRRGSSTSEPAMERAGRVAAACVRRGAQLNRTARTHTVVVVHRRPPSNEKSN